MEATFAFLVVAEVYRVTAGLVREQFYVGTSMTWSHAHYHCLLNYRSLSSIWSQDDAGSEAGETAWIGLRRQIQYWKWSNGEFANFFNWRRDLFCALMMNDGTWIEKPCNSNNAFVCYTEDNNGRNYTYIPIRVTWSEAQERCRKNQTGLVSVRNMAENTAVKIAVEYNDAWFGLFSDPWEWSDGGSSNFQNFYQKSNGIQGCVSAGSGGWLDSNCESTLFVICCEADGTKSILERCKRHSEKMNWTSAQAFCRQNNEDLPTVYSSYDSFLLKFVALPNDYWIGMFHGKQNWRWDNQDEVTYTNWRALLFCTVMDSEGFWNDRVCFEKHPFACQTEAQGVGKNYTLVLESKIWSEAQKYCRDKHSDLATVTNQEENTALRKQAPDTVPEFWIGLFNDPWTWIDGSSLTFQKWESTEPDNGQSLEECVVTRNDMWYDEQCSNAHPFFCYDDMREMVLVREKKTWEEALDSCRTDHTDLTSLLSVKEMRLGRKKIRGTETAHVWTGLRFLTGTWMWVNRDYLSYEGWGVEGRPRCPVVHRCGALCLETGLWEARPCEEKLNFLCIRQ
ncbi:hypothetical protein AAFF_G00399660 [Aldrovandia affinis]|uniref:C-type lectin domain-containing protein n=1 Tax=Aldrovandia affinis TaxID=143900 RepID=A0AAD7WKI9_9TELE|nr:hypothetical protein AAFF_G00399660 [Aldrovandia affinis]